MKLEQAQKTFAFLISDWLYQDQNYLTVGFTVLVSKMKLLDNIFTWFDRGTIFRIVKGKKLIGFVFFENPIQNKSAFHIFVVPKCRTFKNAMSLLKNVFNTGFNRLGFESLYTMADERQSKYLRRSVMTTENKEYMGYTIFSLNKKDI